MSYQVIARKYRPQSFADLIGQEHVATSLKNALANGRTPHAVLFSGTRGVGKTTIARIFAKSIRCTNRKDNNPCNECTSCKEITSGSCVDVLEIDGASNNGVDAIRELRESVSYMPSSGSHKIYIIDEVHMLSNSAFNALLKTLEEPPKHVVFMFATTEPQKIPATILSRCQRYDLKNVSTREITNLLLNIAEKEQIEHEGEALWFIAKSGSGSVRDAFSAMDLCISFSNKKLTEQNVSEVLGISDRNLRIRLLQSLAKRDKEDLLAIVASISASSIDSKVFMQNLLEDLRNLLLLKIGGSHSKQILDISDNEAKELQEITDTLSEEEIHMLFDMALKGANDIHQAFEPKIVLEMIFMRMANAPRIEFLYSDPSQQPKANIANPIEEKKSPKTKEKPRLTKTDINKSPSKKNIALLRNEWGQIVSTITDKNPLLGNKLRNVAIQATNKDSLVLALDPEHKFMLGDLNEEKTSGDILAELKISGFQLNRLQFVLANDENKSLSIEKEEVLKKQKHEEEIKQKIENSSCFNEAKKVFNFKTYQIKEMS